MSNNVLDCFKYPYIGVKGACDGEPSSGLYWHYLPKINIKKAAKLADGITSITGVGLLKEYEERAIREVVSEFTAMLSDVDHHWSSILGDIQVNNAGSTDWKGDEDVFYGFKYLKYRSGDKFQKACLDSFGIFVDRDIKKIIYVDDEYGTKEIEVDLVKGYNKVCLDIDTNSCWFRVYFNGLGFKFGRKTKCGCGRCDKCTPCLDKCGFVSYEISEDGLCFGNTNNSYFDICVQCRCSEEEIACYFKKDLAYPILYKAGILVTQDQLMSDSIDPCFRNNKEDFKYILQMLDDITYMEMGEAKSKKGKYKISLYQAMKKAKSQISKLDTACICCTSGKTTKGF